MDLTAIEKPFGLLEQSNPEVAAALQKAHEEGAEIEYWQGDRWDPINPAWIGELTYRVRPTPKPPAIEAPWEVIDPRWKWVAMDEDGLVFTFIDQPGMSRSTWIGGRAETNTRRLNDLITGIRVNVTDWRESLTRRPE